MTWNADSPETASSREDAAQFTWLHAATGQIIRVQMLDGKKLIGQLLAFDHAALVVQGSAPTPLLVFKQSIAYLAVEEQPQRP